MVGARILSGEEEGYTRKQAKKARIIHVVLIQAVDIIMN